MPSPVVVQGASLLCAAGTAPATLSVSSQQLVQINGLPVATVADCAGSNIPPFGTCNVLTAAALGVPTVCALLPAGMWTPGSAVRTINGQAVLTSTCSLSCGVGGVISITDPGQTLQTSD